MPIWLDAHGQRVLTRPCPKCGKDSPERRYRYEHLRMIGWGQPGQVVKIVNWCGQVIPWRDDRGWCCLIPVLGEAQ